MGPLALRLRQAQGDHAQALFLNEESLKLYNEIGDEWSAEGTRWAAGMAATFGSPVSAVLLAVELLLFEFRPRSLVPVALASATATAVRMAFAGTAP